MSIHDEIEAIFKTHLGNVEITGYIFCFDYENLKAFDVSFIDLEGHERDVKILIDKYY